MLVKSLSLRLGFGRDMWYGPQVPSFRDRFKLCGEALDYLWKIPAATEQLDIEVYDEEVVESYRFKTFGQYIIVFMSDGEHDEWYLFAGAYNWFPRRGYVRIVL